MRADFISDSLYENLLDEYEPGMKVDRLQTIFDEVRPHLSQLLTQIVSSEVYPHVKGFNGNFPAAAQDRFGRDVLTAMGFDWEAGRLDRSPHPFCSGLSPLDVRITTRYLEKDFSGALFGMIHEGGHALYEQGLDPAHQGLPICEAISLGIHESQSRLWENQVGRSRAFWQYWFPHLQEAFPGELDGHSFDEFILAINLVKPSLIRVTADEVTYGLHIILRFELERDLLHGDLDASDLPEAWNHKMETYLDLRPASDSDGALQDVHWSHGLIGYFPTYLLGNLYAAQLVKKAGTDIPDLEDNLAAGRLLPLREWLRTHVHQLGKTLSAEEMILQVTGESLSSQFFLGYLDAKFEELYEL